MKRHTNNKSLEYAKNIGEILTHVNNHVAWLPEKEANQTDPKYYTYDISCNEDFALHSKYYDWKRIFKYFKDHERAKASLATKIIPDNFLSFNPNKKVRIRFSLMPQKMSSLLEPNTPAIEDRIKAIDTFIKAGYEVHINFSPIIVCENWLDSYKELFEQVNEYVEHKNEVFAECIFMTHNHKKHSDNLEIGRPGEYLLWNPKIQEFKKSQYGGDNLRYKHDLKRTYIAQFKKLHNQIIPWNKIRYIF
jgi:spore photoproduct lyase